MSKGSTPEQKSPRSRGRQSALTPDEKARLRSLIRQAPDRGYTLKDMARMIGCSPGTIYKFRREYLAAQTADEQAEKLRNSRITPGDAVKEAILNEPEPEPGVIDPEKTMRILSGLAQEGIPAVQVPAAKLLEDLRRRYAPPDSAGPPPPTTKEELVDRLSVLIACAGPEVTHEALLVAQDLVQHSPSDRGVG